MILPVALIATAVWISLLVIAVALTSVASRSEKLNDPAYESVRDYLPLKPPAASAATVAVTSPANGQPA